MRLKGQFAVVNNRRVLYDINRIERRAVAFWRADAYDASNDRLTDLSGNGNHARFGSGVGTDTNDPLWLNYAGKYVYAPARAGDRITTPDSAATSVTTAIDVRVRCQPSAITGASDRILWAKGYGSGWYFMLTSAGLLYFAFVNASSVSRAVVADNPLTAEEISAPRWYRFTRVSSSGAYTFSKSDNGTDWTTIKSGTLAAGEDLVDRTDDNELFGNAGGAAIEGRLWVAELRASVDGAIVAAFYADALSEPYQTWVNPSTGETWTLNRTATGRKLTVVDRATLLFGTDDYLEVTHNNSLNLAAGAGLTAVVAMRIYAVPAVDFSGVICKADTGDSAGWRMEYRNTALNAYCLVNDATNVAQQSSPVMTAGVACTSTLTYDRSAELLRQYKNTTAGTPAAGVPGTIVDCSNTTNLFIGRWFSGTRYLDFEFFAAAVFGSTLTSTELAMLTRQWAILP